MVAPPLASICPVNVVVLENVAIPVTTAPSVTTRSLSTVTTPVALSNLRFASLVVTRLLAPIPILIEPTLAVPKYLEAPPKFAPRSVSGTTEVLTCTAPINVETPVTSRLSLTSTVPSVDPNCN